MQRGAVGVADDDEGDEGSDGDHDGHGHDTADDEGCLRAMMAWVSKMMMGAMGRHDEGDLDADVDDGGDDVHRL